MIIMVISDLLVLCDFDCSIVGGHEDDDDKLSLPDRFRLIIYMHICIYAHIYISYIYICILSRR